MTDDEIRAIKPFAHTELNGKSHLIGNVSYEEDDAKKIIRAAVYSVTDQKWIVLIAPKRALNDPVVDCCGRDAGDCDCYPPLAPSTAVPSYEMPNADAEY